MKFLTVLAFTVASVLCATQALECGIDNTTSQKDFQQIAQNCMTKKVEEKKKVVSEDGEEEEEAKVTTTDSTNIMKRTKRNEATTKTPPTGPQEQPQPQLSIATDSIKNNLSNNTGKDNCVVQCILGQMGMTDSSGYPEHHRVSEALLKNAQGRELRDFVQDTTDECFQLMDHGEKQDLCQYSISLVNCLAEKGKSNCADWPVGNLAFLHSKN